MRAAQRQRLKKAFWVFLTLALLILGVVFHQAYTEAQRQLPGYLSARLSQALGRPVAVGRVGFRLPATFSLKEFRLEPLPDEERPPLVADRVRVGISWWELIIHRRLRVTGITLERPQIFAELDLREEKKDQPTPAESLLALRDQGLERIRIVDASAEVLTVLPNGQREVVRAGGLDFDTHLGRERFRYRAGADQWSGAGIEAANLSISGSGDQSGIITVVDSSARYRGGTLEAKGTLGSQNGAVTMQVQVKDLPLENLAPQLGIPEQWNVVGNLTGSVDLNAASGELRRALGTITVARGFVSRSQAVFPWSQATARLDWKPEGIRLDQIDVQGNGIELKGAARVGGTATTPIPQRPYQASGTVTATSSESVAALAELLAFSTPLEGRWGVEQASVQFQAQGRVGELQNSRATGRFQATNFSVRPPDSGTPLVIRTVNGDLVRGPDVLRLENLRGTAEGLSGSGQLEVIPTTDERPGRYTGSARVDLVNLTVLRQQLPDLPLWQWLRPARSQSRGQLTVQASGPTRHPEQSRGTGSFRFQEFDVAVNAGQGQTWAFPLRSLTGSLSMEGNRLAARDLKLRSDLFTGGGAVALAPISETGRLSGSVRLASQRWEELPPLQGRVPPGLKGGTLVVETRLTGTPAQGRIPVVGVISLQDARYTGKYRGETRTAQLEGARVEFRTEGERIVVPAYRLLTPQFRTSGSGTLVPAGGGAWSVQANGRISTADAGAVLRWWTGQNSLRGGNLSAQYDLRTRTDRPEQAVVDARVRLTDAVPVLPQGALPFPAADARIQTATGRISVRGNTVRFQDLNWRAPRFTAAGDGTLVNNVLTADVRLSTPQWRSIAGELARSLPVSGGTLVLTGHLEGRTDRLKNAPFRGTLALRGARLESDRNASVPLEGGVLDLKAQANGTLTNLVGSRIAGNFALRSLTLPALAAGRSRVSIQSARGNFVKEGQRVSLTDFVAQVPGARLTGTGELRGVGTGSASHSFRVNAAGPALAGILPALAPLPGRAAGGRFSGWLQVSGTAAEPVRQMEGRAQVQSAEWTPPGQTQSLAIERMAAHFIRRGDTATLDNVEVRVAGGGHATLAGTLSGLNTRGAARHDLRVNWRLEDASAWASRFFPIPGWFTGGVFTGSGRIAGTRTAPAQSASGEFRIVQAGFMPPAQVLGGPVRPITVNHAQGRWTRRANRTVLSRLDLNTSIGTASGRVVATDRGGANVQAKVDIARLEPLVDLWPGFKDRIVGGRGEMTIAVRGPLRQPRRLAGTIAIRSTGGMLTVENVDPLYAEQPFDELTTLMELPGNGGARLTDVKLRGPKANLDGEATISPEGVVAGKGRAWFSKAYTKQLIKPKFLYPIAKLVGHGKLNSRFEVHGTLARARLDMGIKDSLLWKVGMKKKVPEDLRRIAVGEAPLWGSPVTERVAGSRQSRRR